MEDYNFQKPAMSLDEKSAVKHFEDIHNRNESSRFIIPLPRKANVKTLGESHHKAAKVLLNHKLSLVAMESSSKPVEAMHEYFEMGH